MNLSFMTQWPKSMPPHLAGKPTFFMQKVANSIPMDDTMDSQEKNRLLVGWFPYAAPEPSDVPKLHSIRRDAKKRWKVGMKIHFYINSRQLNMFRFAPIIPVVSIQKIEIKITSHNTEGDVSGALVFIDGYYFAAFCLYNDLPSTSLIEQLATNDGFDSVQDFFAYFNEDFEGKLIHWTNLKY